MAMRGDCVFGHSPGCKRTDSNGAWWMQVKEAKDMSIGEWKGRASMYYYYYYPLFFFYFVYMKLVSLSALDTNNIVFYSCLLRLSHNDQVPCSWFTLTVFEAELVSFGSSQVKLNRLP